MCGQANCTGTAREGCFGKDFRLVAGDKGFRCAKGYRWPTRPPIKFCSDGSCCGALTVRRAKKPTDDNGTHRCRHEVIEFGCSGPALDGPGLMLSAAHHRQPDNARRGGTTALPLLSLSPACPEACHQLGRLLWRRAAKVPETCLSSKEKDARSAPKPPAVPPPRKHDHAAEGGGDPYATSRLIG